MGKSAGPAPLRTAWGALRGSGPGARQGRPRLARVGSVSAMSTDSFSTATERDALQSYLDEMRQVLVRKVDGLSEQDARRASTVSSLSLLAILKHCAVWERRWFQVVFAGRPDPDGWPAVRGEPDGTFALGDDDTVDSVLADYPGAGCGVPGHSRRGRPRRPVRAVAPG